LQKYAELASAYIDDDANGLIDSVEWNAIIKEIVELNIDSYWGPITEEDKREAWKFFEDNAK